LKRRGIPPKLIQLTVHSLWSSSPEDTGSSFFQRTLEQSLERAGRSRSRSRSRGGRRGKGRVDSGKKKKKKKKKQKKRGRNKS
jgi:hypothetical protein